MKLKAISPYFSSFVSASAGTGKTKTLIDRLLNLLLSGVKPNKILCLTFTKAAAAEILHRIDHKLSSLCICDDKTLYAELGALGISHITPDIKTKARILFSEFVDAVEPMNVQTIHSFCQDLLSKFPSEAGVGINFNLLDDAGVIDLINEAKEIVLNSAQEYPYLQDVFQYLSWHLKDYSLNELLKEIISNQEKLDYFFRMNQDISLELKNNELDLLNEFISLIPLKEVHLNILKMGGKTDINRAENIEKFMRYSLELKAIMIDEYFSCFLTKTGSLLKSVLTKNLGDDHPNLNNLLSQEQQRVYKFVKLYNDLKTNNLTQSFITLSYYLREVYQKLKKTNNVLDYNDLISYATNLLSSSEHAEWVRYKLDGGIDHILVDEAQDNSFNQWAIINKITEEFFNQIDKSKSIFIVGDAKQSIFRFQGAAPEIFHAMNINLPPEVVRVQLNSSFRSGRAVLRLVDTIFNRENIKGAVGNIEKKIEHIVNRDVEGAIEVWPLVLDSQKKEDHNWCLPVDLHVQDDCNGDEILANKIATHISNWLKEKKFIHCKSRFINPSDILILTRRRNSFIHTLIKALKDQNIPVAGVDRIKLLDHPAILDILALSNSILCPADDFNLSIVLRSPILGISEEQLLNLCYGREASLWSIIKKIPEYEEICSLIENANSFSLLELYFNLIEVKGIREKFISHFGYEVNEILDVFLDVVERFETEENSSLQLFINFINNSSIEFQKDSALNSNQVRIMTVHGAKGLQSPVVFLVDTVSLPHNDDTIIWCNEKKLLWPGKAKYFSDVAVRAKLENNSQEYAEYLRLLYVALTRAEDELIITGISKDQNISDKCWYSIISQSV